MHHISEFKTLSDAYRGFILDLWGVIHDGVKPYPGAVDCLARIKAAGRPAVLLSNAPRRAAAAQAAMRTMGIADHLYTGILTSGEATHMALRDRTDPWFAALGTRMLHLGPARDRNAENGGQKDDERTAPGHPKSIPLAYSNRRRSPVRTYCRSAASCNSRSRNFWTFPEAVSGKSWTIQMKRGTLWRARRSRQ